jgi:hypothetical protein
MKHAKVLIATARGPSEVLYINVSMKTTMIYLHGTLKSSLHTIGVTRTFTANNKMRIRYIDDT